MSEETRPNVPTNTRPLIVALIVVALLVIVFAAWQARTADPVRAMAPNPTLHVDGEVHLQNIRQLTFGGENAEAYWAPDGRRLIFQSKRDGMECDQIFTMRADGMGVRMVSTGQGRTTCSYFMPDGKIIYASTHGASPDCPPPPDYSMGYVWAIYPGYDLYVASGDGSDPTPLVPAPGYDAEATLDTQGERIVFTSTRDGDLDIYMMNVDGTDLRRITDTPGYDGGAFFSHDGAHIVWRASRPEGEALAEYRRLLSEDLIRPSELEIFIADTDGSNVRQVTSNGAANFAPYFTPGDQRIIFASNMDDPSGRDFDLFLVNLDGTGLERVTYYEDFDSFPMFSPDGKYLVWASNRNGSVEGETNVFVAEWVEGPQER